MEHFFFSYKVYSAILMTGVFLCACEKIDRTPELSDPVYKLFVSELDSSQKAKEKLAKDLEAAIKSRDTKSGSIFVQVGFQKDVERISRAIKRADQDILYKQIRVKRWALLVRKQYLLARNQKLTIEGPNIKESDDSETSDTILKKNASLNSVVSGDSSTTNSVSEPKTQESERLPSNEAGVHELQESDRLLRSYEINQRLRKSPRDWSHRVPKIGKLAPVAKSPPAAH